MHILKNLAPMFLVFVSVSGTFAQDVVKNIVVEHFTNTRCGICASRNPAFYNALPNRPDVIHIAYHPSSPYSSCLFSTQNRVENDARTRYYNIYGSTPRFIINGNERSGSQVSNERVYQEFQNQTSPVDLTVQLAKAGDEIEVFLAADIKSSNNIGNVQYFIALVEDTVFYNAPNGENIHRDVFRKSSSDNLPSFPIPQNGGESFVYTAKLGTESFWDLSRIYAIVILTDTDKKVVQAARSPLYNPDILSSVTDKTENKNYITVYPNPVVNDFDILSLSQNKIDKVTVLNQAGQPVKEVYPDSHQTTLSLDGFNPGIYFIQVISENMVSIQKIVN